MHKPQTGTEMMRRPSRHGVCQHIYPGLRATLETHRKAYRLCMRNSFTGPSRPDSTRGASDLYAPYTVTLYFSCASDTRSPMMRLGQRLVTATSMRFDPVLRADVTSSVKGGFQRISGSLCPLRVTSANSRTRPRSSRTLEPERSHPFGKEN